MVHHTHPCPTWSSHGGRDPLSAPLSSPKWHLCKKAEAFDVPLIIIQYCPKWWKNFTKLERKEIKIFSGRGGERLGLVVNMDCLSAARVDTVTVLTVTNTIHFNCVIKIVQGIYCNFHRWIAKYLTNINYHNLWEDSDFWHWGKRVINLPTDAGCQWGGATCMNLQREMN